jgi:hypothetical protein
MFCPRCGQQQLSEEVRFCPRCGLPLAGVSTLLTDGVVVRSAEVARETERPARRAGIRRGAKIMFFSAVIAPLFFAISVFFDSAGPLLVPFTVFLAGLAALLYSLFFGEDFVPAWIAKRRELRATQARPALDAPQFVPASAANYQRVNTAEIAQPPSVTENTTKLLDKDQQQS